jgi:3-deoxy-7-phosphoheptulonate synthase
MGLLLESNLCAGKQSWKPGAPPRRGVSITDACMGWNETEDLLYEIAEAVKVSS